MTNQICPSCYISREKKVVMLRYSGIPEYLDMRPVARQHPIAVLRPFAERTVSQVMETIEQRIYYYKCPECGYIEIHEKVR
ncbi:MAG: hypothetical protein QXP81_10375, partial [Nitrososphaerota archaeon]